MDVNDWTFEHCVHQLRRHLADQLLEESGTKVLRRLRTRNIRTDWGRCPLPGEMGTHSQWLAAQGLLEIAETNGEFHGWQTLRRSLHWQYWSQWVIVEGLSYYKPSRRGRSWVFGGIDLNDVAIMFAHAVGTRDDEIARAAGDWLTWRLDNRPNGLATWSVPVERFLLELYRRWHCPDLDIPRDKLPGLGPYEPVLDCWDDPAAFATAVHTICDYRCEQVTAVWDDYFVPSFLGYPAEMLPVEILALRRVREDEGLEFPAMSHPILETPWFTTLPKEPPDFVDDDLGEAKSYFPAILDNAARASNE